MKNNLSQEPYYSINPSKESFYQEFIRIACSLIQNKTPYTHTHTHNVSKQKAFSLIELSIVLIIMGLLIAGVTGGRSLIYSAKLRTFMMEVNDLRMAFYSYYVKYGEIPEQDGKNYEHSLGYSNSQFYDSCLVFNTLINEGLINSKIADCDDGTYGGPPSYSKKMLLPSKISDIYWLTGAAYSIDVEDNGKKSGLKNVIATTGKDGEGKTGPPYISVSYYNLSGGTVNNYLNNSFASSTNKDAKLIDEKTDDGIRGTGKTQSYTGQFPINQSGACNYSNTAEKRKACIMYFHIGLGD
jgi:prepilin-type N-terminal cleavage/methylation domain-containing protein